MARKRRRARDQQSTDDRGFRRRATAVGARRKGGPAGDAWELVHPRCARDRAEDIEEVEAMIDAGEVDVAIDELRWLLAGCGDFIQAHRLLGELALGEGDLQLARGHFGYAFEIGYSALPVAWRGTLPYGLKANAPLHEAAKGLAWCLHELGRTQRAVEVVREMLRWDRSDPLGVSGWLESWTVPPGPAP